MSDTMCQRFDGSVAVITGAGRAFAEEIVPVEDGGRTPLTVDRAEHPRGQTILETPSGRRPENGSVTAGNASGINDGAAAVVGTRESVARERGLSRLVTLEAVAPPVLHPALTGSAPALALQNLVAGRVPPQ